MKRLPRGAWPIAEARAAGKRPKHGVIVSFVGPVRYDNPVVYAQPGEACDWQWAAALDVLVLVQDGQQVGPALRGLHAVARQVDVVDVVSGNGWLLCGFKPSGDPMTCRWMDKEPAHKARLIDWSPAWN